MREFPGRPHHHTPGWVNAGATFHLRLRSDPACFRTLVPDRGEALLTAAQRYHQLGRWCCTLFLVMPDHVHALVAFPPAPGMLATVMLFKRATARLSDVRWQSGFFDHRLRSPAEADATWHYIRRNPVVKGLCSAEDQWPWSWRPQSA